MRASRRHARLEPPLMSSNRERCSIWLRLSSPLLAAPETCPRLGLTRNRSVRETHLNEQLLAKCGAPCSEREIDGVAAMSISIAAPGAGATRASSSGRSAPHELAGAAPVCQLPLTESDEQQPPGRLPPSAAHLLLLFSPGGHDQVLATRR